MKKNLLILLITIMSALNLNAQNYIYHGDNQYESTSTWTFKLNGQYSTDVIELTIAKHSNGGYLMLSIEVPTNGIELVGTVYVFLENGSIIKCTDKNIKDYVDNKAIALYNYTMDEIEKLKESHISKIRFSMNTSESFTADNENQVSMKESLEKINELSKKNSLSTIESIQFKACKSYLDYAYTPNAIKDLFNVE